MPVPFFFKFLFLLFLICNPLVIESDEQEDESMETTGKVRRSARVRNGAEWGCADIGVEADASLC